MNIEQDRSVTMECLQAQVARQAQELDALRTEINGLIRHDPLTGVANRRGLLEMLDMELVRSHRTGHPFCFAVVDIDHFSTVNLRYGASTGDLTLRTFSNASVKLLRALDRFGRLGGDMFGILMPATWLDSGVIAMTRLRTAVAACDWETITPNTAITFSAGLTTNAPADSAELVLQRAEKALLQAKTEGRNRTVTLEDALPEMPVLDD